MAFHQFTTLDLDVPPEVLEPWDDWEKEVEIPPQVCALYFSAIGMNPVSL